MTRRSCPRLLAIDPATSCGYSYIDLRKPVLPGTKAIRAQSGIWDLSSNRFEGPGMRFLRLKNYLYEMDPDMIVYEQVNFVHKSKAAAQVYFGCTSAIQMFCEENGVHYTTVTTGDLKKRATGKGSGGKPPVLMAANEFFELDTPFDISDKPTNHDSDIADAMWICQIAIETHGRVIDFRRDRPMVEETKKLRAAKPVKVNKECPGQMDMFETAPEKSPEPVVSNQKRKSSWGENDEQW